MAGRKLGNYLLLEEVGRGGMGSVYKARDTRLDRTVAVKLLTETRIDEEYRRRFLQEAKALSALNHPGIVTLHDIGEDGGFEFLVMEYVEGPTLATVIAGGRLPVQTALQHAECIARAVSAAHAVGIIHRDLKPGNVIVKPSGDLKVLDFGVAKLVAAGELTDETRTTMTSVGTALGTPFYMSPEQAVGHAVDHRSDIFSLGVMLYEMLAGARPFSGRHTAALIHAIHYHEPPPISPPPPEFAYNVVRRALAKDPGDRYPSMDALASDLKLALEDIDSPGRWGSRGGRTRASSRRFALPAVTAALVLAVAGAGIWFIPGNRVEKAELVAAVDSARPAHELVSEARALMNRSDVPSNVEKAIAILRAAAQTHSDHAASHASLALVLTQSEGGKPSPAALQEAKQHADRAVSLEPQLALAHVSVAGCLFAAGRYSEAEGELAKAVKLDPENGQAHLLFGALHYKNRSFEQSERAYREAVRLQPDDFEARIGLAALHYHRGNHKDAEAQSLAAVTLAPDSPRPHQMLGSMYYAQGRLAEAARAFQKSLEIQPSARVYSNLGTVYFFREMYSESAAAFDKATRLQPDRYLYWGNLGDAYRWTPGGRDRSNDAYDRAIVLAREALKSNPDDLETRSRFAVLLAKRGDREGARKEIGVVERSEAEKTGPLYYRTAIAYEVIGDRDKALAALERALNANYSVEEIRKDPELRELRGDTRYVRLASRRVTR